VPLESALILEHVSTGDLNQPAQASWLTFRDTFTSLDLREAALAILSGCESGRLMPDAVDDYVNLPTGFLYAGARCVISTLRAINDLSGSLVMAKFHELWDAGRGLAPALALRNAARWLRDEIRSKRQLERDILPALLGNIEDAESLRACDAAWREHSEHLSEEYPFASPVHWAPFIASGLPFSLPFSPTQEKRSDP
jgi:CHAT domain-containing protein